MLKILIFIIYSQNILVAEKIRGFILENNNADVNLINKSKFKNRGYFSVFQGYFSVEIYMRIYSHFF